MSMEPYPLQWHLEKGPDSLESSLDQQNLVPFSPGCDTLELGKTPWSSSHQQGEMHETLPVYHRCATGLLPPADQRLAPGFTPSAPAHHRLLRTSRTTPSRAPVLASPPQ